MAKMPDGAAGKWERSRSCAPIDNLLPVHALLFILFLAIVLGLTAVHVFLVLLFGRSRLSGKAHGGAQSNGKECSQNDDMCEADHNETSLVERYGCHDGHPFKKLTLSEAANDRMSKCGAVSFKPLQPGSTLVEFPISLGVRTVERERRGNYV